MIRRLLLGSLWLGTGGGAGRAPTPRGPELLRPRHQALPDSGPRSPGGGGHRGGGIPAGIPTPPPQFVHFLPWLQISTISFSGHLRPLPLPGPELTLAGDRTVLVLPAPSWEPGWPSVKHPASRPQDAQKGAEPERGAPGVQAGLCEPQPCAYPQGHIHGAYCVPEQSWCGDSLRWEAAATGRMRAAPRAKGEHLPVHLESTASHPREGRLHGEGPAGCRGPGVQCVDAGAPHLSRRISADPGRGWQCSFQKVAERRDSRFFAGALPKFRETAPGDQCPQDEEGASQSPKQGVSHPGRGLCWRPCASILQGSLAPRPS